MVHLHQRLPFVAATGCTCSYTAPQLGGGYNPASLPASRPERGARPATPAARHPPCVYSCVGRPPGGARALPLSLALALTTDPNQVAHVQFRSRIAFKLVWVPPALETFVLVDDAGVAPRRP